MREYSTCTTEEIPSTPSQSQQRQRMHSRYTSLHNEEYPHLYTRLIGTLLIVCAALTKERRGWQACGGKEVVQQCIGGGVVAEEEIMEQGLWDRDSRCKARLSCSSCMKWCAISECSLGRIMKDQTDHLKGGKKKKYKKERKTYQSEGVCIGDNW